MVHMQGIMVRMQGIMVRMQGFSKPCAITLPYHYAPMP